MPKLRLPGGYNPNAPMRGKIDIQNPNPGEGDTGPGEDFPFPDPAEPPGDGGGGGGDDLDDRGNSEKPREIHPEMPQSPSPESKTGPIDMPPINPTPNPKTPQLPGQNPNPFYPPDPGSMSMPMFGGAGGLLGGGQGVPGRMTDNRPPTDLLMMLAQLINGGQ